MPVSYGASDILKCSVTFSYIRYVRERKPVNISSAGGSINRNLFSAFFA